MSRCGDFYENQVTGERAVVLRGDEDSHGRSGLVQLTVQPHGAVVGEHIHPQFRERFRVISGRLGTRVDGVERTLVAGQEAAAAAGSAHDWWNAGEDQAQVLVEFLPLDPRFGLMIGNMFGLANAGRTNAKGMPGLLQLALIGREFQGVMRFTKPPRAVQTVMFGLLGPLGRMRGYRGVYPEYSRPQGHTAPDPAVLAIAGLAPPDNPHAGARGLTAWPRLVTARPLCSTGADIRTAWAWSRTRCATWTCGGCQLLAGFARFCQAYGSRPGIGRTGACWDTAGASFSRT